MDIPTDRSYTSDHEWLDDAAVPATVGITAYAADALGDVVYVDLPKVGRMVKAGETFGEIESTKSVSDLFSPATGEVVEVNARLTEDPSLVNTDPYGAGWLVRIMISEVGATMDADAYRALVG